MSIYLDDTNLSRISSGNLDAETGVVTFTRDDQSAFEIDLSSLIDIQIQGDWNQADNTKPDFIKNKPTIPDSVAALGVEVVSIDATAVANKLYVLAANLYLDAASIA